MESPERFEFKFLLGGALPEDFLAQLGDALTPDRQGDLPAFIPW